MSDTPFLSRPIELSRIGEGGLTETIVADNGERLALAEAFDLRELRSLTAEVKLLPVGKAGILAEGRIMADLVQTCVVSLVPVDQTIDETFSVKFFRQRSADRVPPPKAGEEIRIDADAIDPPEMVTGSVLDLGPVIVEHFALAIDPYPRAPNAVLPPEAADPGGPDEDSPFAALAALKRDSKESG